MDIEDPEVSFARYHDRYMAVLRGQYEAGRMEGEARALRKSKEQSEAIQEIKGPCDSRKGPGNREK